MAVGYYVLALQQSVIGDLTSRDADVSCCYF
ncbi:hypothetical protein SAMN04490179_1292 [Pseudomonas antarctica]|uniref:Uncharacterized protein n=1 Tax=Pseudomonas antarctica TaxID=219572 RepID=A0A1G9WNP2_9PSED|nr:hypothetical protein PSAN_19280 [Pseudomonas antarctica]SDM86174.1 hypothetical protein SAMN04490179_1292 [Pseudomonas antarctica]